MTSCALELYIVIGSHERPQRIVGRDAFRECERRGQIAGQFPTRIGAGQMSAMGRVIKFQN